MLRDLDCIDKVVAVLNTVKQSMTDFENEVLERTLSRLSYKRLPTRNHAYILGVMLSKYTKDEDLSKVILTKWE